MKEIEWHHFSMFIVILIVLGSITIIQPVEGVGDVTFTITMDMEYDGSNQNDPLDISQSENGIIEIEMYGEIRIESTGPHIIQEVNVYLDASPVSLWTGFEDEFNYRFEPTHISFKRIIPNQIQVENFTLTIYVNKYFSPGENGIIIGGSWRNDPGVLSGTLNNTTMPLHILEYNALKIKYFDSTGAYIFTNGGNTATGFIERVGNIQEPLIHVELEGVEDARNKGFEFDVKTKFDPLNDPYGHIWVTVTTSNTNIGDHVDISIILVENGTGYEYDRYIWNVLVQKESEPVPDDDVSDPPSDDNTDSHPGDDGNDSITDDGGEDTNTGSISSNDDDGRKLPFPGFIFISCTLIGFGFIYGWRRRRNS